MYPSLHEAYIIFTPPECNYISECSVKIVSLQDQSCVITAAQVIIMSHCHLRQGEHLRHPLDWSGHYPAWHVAEKNQD